MIGGNKKAVIQIKTTKKNAIGEAVKTWADIQTIKGWLDRLGGDSTYTTYKTKLQESTHVFICDYVKLDARIKAENSRMVIGGKAYDVKSIDDPMEMHKQLEFELKFTGGQ